MNVEAPLSSPPPADELCVFAGGHAIADSPILAEEPQASAKTPFGGILRRVLRSQQSRLQILVRLSERTALRGGSLSEPLNRIASRSVRNPHTRRRQRGPEMTEAIRFLGRIAGEQISLRNESQLRR